MPLEATDFLTAFQVPQYQALGAGTTKSISRTDQRKLAIRAESHSIRADATCVTLEAMNDLAALNIPQNGLVGHIPCEEAPPVRAEGQSSEWYPICFESADPGLTLEVP